MSLSLQITEYMKQRPFEWVNGGEIERLSMLEWFSEDGAHYKASNASRRLRELAHPIELLRQHPEWRTNPCKECSRGILEHREDANGSVEYRYNRIMNQLQVKKEEKVPTQPALI